MTEPGPTFGDLPDFRVLQSVWKPLRGPLHDWPLAVCDAATVSEQDMMAHDQVFTDTVRENQMVRFNSRQNWYYLSGQTQSELLVFRQVDSEHNQGTQQLALLTLLAFIIFKSNTTLIQSHTMPFADSVEKGFLTHPFLFPVTD